jgi:hypothetical protein
LNSFLLSQHWCGDFHDVQDRQKTLKEIQTFFDTKIAPKEIVDELKVLCCTLLFLSHTTLCS